MSKKINIQDKAGKWEGLWYHPESHSYTSSVFNVNSLRDYKGNFQIIARKNRLHKDGDNKPNMIFMVCGSDYANAKDLEFEEMDNEPPKEERKERLYTEDEVYQIIHGMEEYYGLSYGNNLIEDYI